MLVHLLASLCLLLPQTGTCNATTNTKTQGNRCQVVASSDLAPEILVRWRRVGGGEAWASQETAIRHSIQKLKAALLDRQVNVQLEIVEAEKSNVLPDSVVFINGVALEPLKLEKEGVLSEAKNNGQKEDVIYTAGLRVAAEIEQAALDKSGKSVRSCGSSNESQPIQSTGCCQSDGSKQTCTVSSESATQENERP